MTDPWSFVKSAGGQRRRPTRATPHRVTVNAHAAGATSTAVTPAAPSVYVGPDEFAWPGIDDVAAHLRGMVKVEDVPVPDDADHLKMECTADTAPQDAPPTDGPTPGDVTPSPSHRPPSPVQLVQCRDDIPTVDDPMWTEFDTRPLPEHFTAIRPIQWDALQQLLEGYAHGNDVMFCDAPTGAGKSLLGEMLRRRMPYQVAASPKPYVGGTYVCHSKSLQSQFVGDFAYADVLMGRANYLPQLDVPGVTCADCTKDPSDNPPQCEWCPRVYECSYEVAKRKAMTSRLAVLNTAYFLNECNHVGRMSQRAFTIMDECDVAESELMGFHEFYIGDRQLERLGVDAPKKGVHKPTIATWFEDVLIPAVMGELRGVPSNSKDVRVIRRRLGLERLRDDSTRVLRRLQLELESGADEDGKAAGALVSWVRDNDAGPMVLKPVRVDDVADRTMLRHSNKWLFMSATIISPGQMADDLGFDQARGGEGLKWGVVEVPMTFPVENRPIYYSPVADMSAKNKNQAWPVMANAVVELCNRHSGENVLVHAVSYELTRYLVDALGTRTVRQVVSYMKAGERDAAVEAFRRGTNSVLVAPSLDRGVDFRDDDCRVVIVAKVPFPYLGDKQVSSRLHSRGGRAWYAVETVRRIVQMTGRATRSMDDWSRTYILDVQFRKNTWANHRGLFPKWWRDALDMVSVSARELRG